MFNWKLSAIVGGIGLILSLMVGLFSGAGFSHSLLRSLIFGAVFFGLGTGVWFLINSFLPELIASDAAGKDGDGMKPGSRINIADDEKILPEVFKGLDDGEDVGDIGDLANGALKPHEIPVPVSAPNGKEQGVDQMPEDGYTKSRERNAQVSANLPEGGLPDLDLLAGSFLNRGDESEEDSGGRPEPVRKPAGNKSQSLEGDFDPKDLAKGIQTILKEDK